jgi:hypothetical protein
MATAHDIDHDTPAAADIRAREAADKRISLSNRECCDEGGWGASSQRVKVQSGVLHRYLDGSSVRITAKSFYAHLIDLANSPSRPGRRPSATTFKKQRRESTPQELAALQRANDTRKQDKQRRETKQAARA